MLFSPKKIRVFFLVLIFPIQVFAENSVETLTEPISSDLKSVNIRGLTFSCNSCQVLDDDFCEVEIKNQRILAPCSYTLDALLEDEIETISSLKQEEGEIRSQLSEESLYEFLYANALENQKKSDPHKEVTLKQKLSVFYLLQLTEKGRQLIIVNYEFFYRNYKDEILQLAKNRRLKPAMLVSLYNFPLVDRSAKEILFKASIFSADRRSSLYNRLALDDFFTLLTSVSLDEDVKTIELFKNELESYGDNLALELANLLRFIESCKKGDDACREFKESDKSRFMLSANSLNYLDSVFPKLSTQTSEKVNASQPAKAAPIKKGIYFYLMISSLIVALLYLLKSIFFKNSLSKPKTFGIRGELVELLAFFNLPKNASPEMLSKRYRERAKLLHPDIKNDDGNSFSILNEKYSRAKELLVGNQ